MDTLFCWLPWQPKMHFGPKIPKFSPISYFFTRDILKNGTNKHVKQLNFISE